jgi:hypothetical protein
LSERTKTKTIIALTQSFVSLFFIPKKNHPQGGGAAMKREKEKKKKKRQKYKRKWRGRHFTPV